MNNRDMAATLFNIATLLRDRQDNPFRIRAYENGARALMGWRSDLAAALTSVPGFGPKRTQQFGQLSLFDEPHTQFDEGSSHANTRN